MATLIRAVQRNVDRSLMGERVQETMEERLRKFYFKMGEKAASLHAGGRDPVMREK